MGFKSLKTSVQRSAQKNVLILKSRKTYKVSFHKEDLQCITEK